MIPKIIHFCWFGKKKIPKDFRKYIKGWKKLCPDFEIKEWNESNFDLKRSRYASEAYRAGKWAFVSDYARFRILYDYGGIYLDTDVELVKPLDELLASCAKDGITGFMGIERPETGDIAPGLICAAEPHNPVMKELLLGYKGRHFDLGNGEYDMTTVVEYTTGLMKKKGFGGNNLICDIEQFRIYPSEYFNPMDMNTGKITVTENTYSIHHYASSWVDGYSRLRGKVYKIIRKNLGEKAATATRKLLGR
ncbi:MAG: glycosyl transferase [Lachnospiraceae bacterium]|nr:glycosyl transferase [Lachnospiraceae bacterium]